MMTTLAVDPNFLCQVESQVLHLVRGTTTKEHIVVTNPAAAEAVATASLAKHVQVEYRLLKPTSKLGEKGTLPLPYP